VREECDRVALTEDEECDEGYDAASDGNDKEDPGR
jgi:hypothetical protein